MVPVSIDVKVLVEFSIYSHELRSPVGAIDDDLPLPSSNLPYVIIFIDQEQTGGS
jgi:hypothetical protein